MQPKPFERWERWLVPILLIGYWLAAWTAALQKSCTFDELAHVVSGYSYWKFNDYRLQPENGNLPQRLGALPLLFGGYSFPQSKGDRHWENADFWGIGRNFLYGMGNDPERMLAWSRGVMAIVGAALSLAVYLCSRRFFGPSGGMISLLVCILNPNILANGPLVTSDILASLCFFLTLVKTWDLFLTPRWRNLVWACGWTSLFFVAKFSAITVVPMLLVLAICRGFNSATMEWRIGFHGTFQKRYSKGLACLALLLVQAIAAIVVIWACYGFRFSISPDSAAKSLNGRSWDTIVPFVGKLQRPLQFAYDYQLMPEAYLYGQSFTIAFAQNRAAFFLGENYDQGWTHFFPVAFLVKNPLPFLGLLILAIAAWFRGGEEPWRSRVARITPWLVGWFGYWGFALTSHLNIGVRHILPVFPIAFVLAGGASYWLCHGPRWLRGVVPGLLLWSVVEAAAIYPHYLAYFNQAAGGPRNGYRLLVDSSLDWGQDLSTLKAWLDENAAKDDRVYLSYLGSADVSHYHLNAIPLQSFFDIPSRPSLVSLQPGLYCISATQLQQVYSPYPGRWNADYERLYRQLQELFGKEGDRLKAGIDEKKMAQYKQAYDALRFGRLCSYLRHITPTAWVGYSILVYRLDEKDLDTALNGLPLEQEQLR